MVKPIDYQYKIIINLENKALTEFIHSEQNKENHEDEPIICARFGCGKKLTLQEGLFGKYCSECAGSSRVVGAKKVDNLESVIKKLIVLKIK